MNKVTAFVIVLAILVGGWYVYRKNNTGSPVATTAQTAQTSAVVASSSNGATTGQTKMFTISGSNYAFSPATITVNKGDTVQITFKSTGGTQNLVLSDFGISTNQLSSGQSQTVTFVANKSGKFQFYCSVGNHRQMGMVGTLVVQ